MAAWHWREKKEDGGIGVSLLRTEDLSMEFGGLVAVSDFELEMDRGEVVGLIGPNGSGKTTVFNMISGFYEPTRGSIVFDGNEIAGLRPDEIAELGIARIFQNGRLFKRMTALENVLMGCHLRLRSASLLSAVLNTPGYLEKEKREREECEVLLDAFGIADIKKEEAGALPFGLQRKLEVTRALASRPKLLLLDEPATGLSVEEIDDMMACINQVREDFDVTVLLIEHTMHVIMGVCQRILVLDHGVTIADGIPSEIQKNPVVIEAYLGVEEDDGAP